MRLYEINGQYYMSREFNLPTIPAEIAENAEGDDTYFLYSISGEDLPEEVREQLDEAAMRDCETLTGNDTLPSEILGESKYYLACLLNPGTLDLDRVCLISELIRNEDAPKGANAKTWDAWIEWENNHVGSKCNNISLMAGSCVPIDAIFTTEAEYKQMRDIIQLTA